MTPFLIERLFPGVSATWADLDDADLVGIGSVLQQFKRHRTSRLHCWGAGYIASNSWGMHDRTQFHAVRGALTLAKLQPGQQRGVVLGDPGLLVGLLFDAQEVETKYELGVVPHYVDASAPLLGELSRSADVSIIDVAAPVAEVVRGVAQCRRIISSSLHGLVLSDALRIPNAWVQFSADVAGDGFKFADYYSGFGREPDVTPLSPMRDLLRAVETRYRPIESLDAVQAALLDTFPQQIAR
ncbi:polysaccharide pyruvyl transferase family protein [Agrococcus pavilionensis]|uniref:polysaccharide pyruvyl transferase family protein n=1 Tax=Agrococcus pavilionensis TaxID=1346502 RepID=UPI00118179AF|nr:polysaccharide pyruvyl transferase family protein [Agrococcus pavilionensis]